MVQSLVRSRVVAQGIVWVAALLVVIGAISETAA